MFPGGTELIKYFCSLGYLYQGDFFKAYNEGYDDTRYNNKRINYRGNVDFNLRKLHNCRSISEEISGLKTQLNSFSWRQLYSRSPARFPAYFPAWVLEEVPDPDYPDASGIRLAEAFGDDSGTHITICIMARLTEIFHQRCLPTLFLTKSSTFF